MTKTWRARNWTLGSTSLLIAAWLLIPACSSDSKNSGNGAVGGSANGGGGGINSNGGSTSPYCLQVGQNCASGQTCCSGVCDPTSHACAASINQCTPANGACVTSTECCSLSCVSGKCSSTSCVADDQACTSPATCCSGNCNAGICQALNTACRTAGNPCTDNAQCCSSLCSGGTCKLGASFCIQTGDVCTQASTCCSGDCQIASGATVGTCAPPPAGATYCSDGVDGTVCSACNGCCSRLCAPYGPTGVNICQPASGCRVNGDLCRKDSDCCGAAGTGLPGDGNVTCEIPAGKALGICRNPQSCNPQGNVCHFKDYACSISSARNDCCAAVGNSGVCQVDFLGVPRCNGLGDTCRKPDETCASANDCCGLAPCVPDGAGVLHCYGPADGGTSTCVPSGGTCSINGDCCPGTTCIQAIGSTQGVCGTNTNTPDGGTDAGPTCAQFGQACTTAADCCNSLPCWNGKCEYQVVVN
jgi:hypothetical protein